MHSCRIWFYFRILERSLDYVQYSTSFQEGVYVKPVQVKLYSCRFNGVTLVAGADYLQQGTRKHQ